MPFQSFSDLCPEVARRETRVLLVPPSRAPGDLPEGEYALLEMFCNERGCDCRRVFLYVLASFREGPEAVVAWGWESREFYADWVHEANDHLITELQGPILNLGSPGTELAGPLLEEITEMLATDVDYTTRIQEHYRLFRQRVERPAPHAWFPAEAGGRAGKRRTKRSGHPRR